MNVHSLSENESKYVSFLAEVQSNIGQRIAAFLVMPIEELKHGIHPVFGIENWRVYLLLCECAGVMYVDIQEALK